MAQATYDDANMILRLYELRREEKMREARAWFVANFKPKTVADMQALCPPGSPDNAKMRMVTSYWDMVASFITSGVLNPELFFASGGELLLVWLRVSPIVAEMRTLNKNPSYFQNLETVGNRFTEYLVSKTSAEAFDAFRARIAG